MYVNILLLAHLFVNQDLADAGAMIALQLDDISELRVLNHSSVAGKLLLEGLEDLVQIHRLWDPLDRSQGLAAIALLNTKI